MRLPIPFNDKFDEMIQEIIQPFIDAMEKMDARLLEVVDLLREINEREYDRGLNTIRGRGKH